MVRPRGGMGQVRALVPDARSDPQIPTPQGLSSALPKPMRAATQTNSRCLPGRACACCKRRIAAGGSAGARARGWGGARRGRGPARAKPRPPRRFGDRCGLLPAVLLRPEGLGALLSGSGLHRENSEEARVGDPQRPPETPQGTTLPPAVPARPPLSAIRSRCCTITRRALARKDPLQGVWGCGEGRTKAPDPGDD